MTRTKVKRKLTAERADRVFAILRNLSHALVGDHLTDIQFAKYGREAMPLRETEDIDQHLAACERCADEMLSRMDEAAFWDTLEGAARIEKGRKALLPTVEVLTFARVNDSAVLLDHKGATITSTPGERNLVSSLLQICRAIARGGYAGTPSGAAAYPLGAQSGHIEWPALHRYAVREQDKLSSTAACAIRAGDGFRAIILVLLNRGLYSLEVLLQAPDLNPLTEGTVSWQFKNREPHTLRVPTGEAVITLAHKATVELSIVVPGCAEMRFAVELT